MSEIESAKQEINDLCAEVTAGIEDLKKAKGLVGVKKADKVAFLKNRINRAKTALRSLKVDLREMPKLEAKPHVEKAAQLEEKIKQIEVDLDWAEKADPAQPGAAAVQSTDFKEVLRQGAAIQEQDIGILGRAQQKLEETRQIGTDTLATQQRQKEQLIQIDKGVDEVASNIKLANRQLRVFVRRIAGDKIIMGFLFLIFLGVIFIIIWSTVIDPKSKSKAQPDNWVVTTGTSSTT